MLKLKLGKPTDHRTWVSGDGNLEGARFSRSDSGVAEQSGELRRSVSGGDRLERAVRGLDKARLDHVLLGSGLDRQRGEAARRAGRVGRLHDVVARVLFEHLGDRQRVKLAFRRDLVHTTQVAAVQRNMTVTDRNQLC